MKMETVIPASATGIVERVLVSAGDNVAADDLLAVIGDAKPPTSGGGAKWRSSGRSKCSARRPLWRGSGPRTCGEDVLSQKVSMRGTC